MRALVSGAAALLLFGAAFAGGPSGAVAGAPVRLQDVPLTIGTPKETPERVPSRSGSGEDILIRVTRIWRTGPRTHAAVRLQNTAQVEFSEVSLACTAVDAENREVGTSRQDVRRERFGAFKPGAIAELDLVFETPHSEVRSLTCDARARGLPQRID
jgi:hypothetical protein